MLKSSLFFVLTLLVAIAVFFSCSNHQQTDEYIIPKQKFIEVLTDLHLAEAMIGKYNKTYQKDSVNIYCLVLEKHNCTKAQIDSSLNFYSSNYLEELTAIHDEVLNALNRIETEIKNNPPVKK